MQRIADIKQQLSTIPDPEIPVITIDELGVLRDVSYQEEVSGYHYPYVFRVPSYGPISSRHKRGIG